VHEEPVRDQFTRTGSFVSRARQLCPLDSTRYAVGEDPRQPDGPALAATGELLQDVMAKRPGRPMGVRLRQSGRNSALASTT